MGATAKTEERQQIRLIVSDTGPLLHLLEAGILDLLGLAGEVHIPKRVEAELASHGAVWQHPTWLYVDPLVEPHISEADSWQQAGLLDAGEAEAMALAQQLQATWLLTDDAAARLLAQKLALEVHGSLGVVLWAAARLPSACGCRVRATPTGAIFIMGFK